MKKTVFTYSTFILIIAALLFLVVFISLSNKQNNDLPPYVLDESDEADYDIANYSEFAVVYKELFLYDEFDADVIFDDTIGYSEYIVSSCEVNLGETIQKNDLIGYSDLETTNIYSNLNGRIVDIVSVDNNFYIKILNADAFSITLQMHQSSFIGFNIDSEMKAILSNQIEVDLLVKKIHYEVVNGYIKIDLVQKIAVMICSPTVTLKLEQIINYPNVIIL
jgi:hypothetical protein